MKSLMKITKRVQETLYEIHFVIDNLKICPIYLGQRSTYFFKINIYIYKLHAIK